MTSRTEQDSMGPVELLANALYGPLLFMVRKTKGAE